MDRKGLAIVLTKLLIPLGYKKKGNHWVRNRREVNTIVEIQKSEFSDAYYINYRFVLNAVPLNGLKGHVYGRVGGSDTLEIQTITRLLDFENDIPDETRMEELEHLFLRTLIPEIEDVETEQDVLNTVEQLPTLNGVPLVVKKHFGLPID